MAKHRCKELNALIDSVTGQYNFRIEWRNSVTFLLFPPVKSLPFHTGHAGEKALGPVKSYLKRVLPLLEVQERI